MPQEIGIGARTPALEWIAGGVGLALLLFAVAVMGNEAIQGDTDQLASIRVEPKRIVAAGSGFVVEFEAVNDTKGAAAAVAIEGVLKSGGEEETAAATLDYVPSEGHATGGLFFTQDPRAGSLELRALGFQEP